MTSPCCPVHADPSGRGGQMRHDWVMCRWTCAGWDGEGCDHIVTDEMMEEQVVMNSIYVQCAVISGVILVLIVCAVECVECQMEE